MSEMNRERTPGANPSNRAILAVALIVVGAAGLYYSGAFERTGPVINFGGVLSEKTETRQLNLAGATSLQVRSFNGRINVTAGAGQPSVEIRQKGDVIVTTEKQGEQYVVSARTRNATCFNCGVSFTLNVPENMQADVATSNGQVTVNGAVRGVRAASSNGAIEITNAGQGSVNASTSNGQVRITNAQGSVYASSSNGRITLENVTLPAGSRNSVHTSNGSIEVRSVRAPEGLRLSGSTSNGGINVNLPGFQVNVDRHSFEASQPGNNQAELRIESSNAGLTVSE